MGTWVNSILLSCFSNSFDQANQETKNKVSQRHHDGQEWPDSLAGCGFHGVAGGSLQVFIFFAAGSVLKSNLSSMLPWQPQEACFENSWGSCHYK